MKLGLPMNLKCDRGMALKKLAQMLHPLTPLAGLFLYQNWIPAVLLMPLFLVMDTAQRWVRSCDICHINQQDATGVARLSILRSIDLSLDIHLQYVLQCSILGPRPLKAPSSGRLGFLDGPSGEISTQLYTFTPDHSLTM